MGTRLAVVTFVALLSSGCGIGTFTGSCDNSKRASGAICTDYQDDEDEFNFSSVRTACTGTWSNGILCSRQGALGGCRRRNPLGPTHGTITVWQYPDATHQTADDVRRECTNGTFVTP
jgi:hypothetical protein